jgi:hypothetical protein
MAQHWIVAAGRGSSAVAEALAAAPIEPTWNVATKHTPVGLYPRSGLLPAVVAVRDQSGDWDVAGQTRQLMLSDGGSVIEHTTNVDRLEFFAYDLTDFQKLFGAIVEGARAEWTFSAAPTGTLIRWRYTFHARPGFGPLLAAIVRLLWGPYMRRVLPGIVAEIEREAEPSPR